jgi:hypothetical protein
MSNFQTLLKIDIKKIGWYQIIGGIAGILTILYLFVTKPHLSRLLFSVYVFFLLFYGYSIFCGILCLKETRKALTYSLINQFLQLISIACLGYAYSYSSGIYISVGLDLSKSVEVALNFGISMVDFAFNSDPNRLELKVNLVAFGLIYWIDKQMKMSKNQKK